MSWSFLYVEQFASSVERRVAGLVTARLAAVAAPVATVEKVKFFGNFTIYLFIYLFIYYNIYIPPVSAVSFTQT